MARGLCVLLVSLQGMLHNVTEWGFRNMQPQLAEAAEMLENKVDSTEQYGGAALMSVLWKLDCSHWIR